MENKKIIITELSQRTITPKPGATWRAFTVYQIRGNDGINYETTDREYFETLKIGETIEINFKTETKTYNDKVYTSYKLILPKKIDPYLIEMQKKIIERMETMEANIIAAFELINSGIKVNTKKVEVNPKQPSLFPEENDSEYDEPNY